jgi:hypothetical protein
VIFSQTDTQLSTQATTGHAQDGERGRGTSSVRIIINFLFYVLGVNNFFYFLHKTLLTASYSYSPNRHPLCILEEMNDP